MHGLEGRNGEETFLSSEKNTDLNDYKDLSKCDFYDNALGSIHSGVCSYHPLEPSARSGKEITNIALERKQWNCRCFTKSFES